MRSLPAFAMVVTLGSSLAGCMGAGEDLSLSGDELSDIASDLDPQAFQIAVTARVCPADDTGAAACDPDEEEPKAAHVLVTGIFDLTAPEPVVRPCMMSGDHGDDVYELDPAKVQRVPSGAVLAGYGEDGGLAAAIALPVGYDMVDPFADTVTDEEASDVDGDGQPGFSYHVAIGSVRFGARLIASSTALVPGAGPSPADVSLDWKIFSDSVPFVNVAKKVTGALEGKVIVYENPTIELRPAQATCEAALAAFAPEGEDAAE